MPPGPDRAASVTNGVQPTRRPPPGSAVVRKAAATKTASSVKHGPRRDLGASVEEYFARQPPDKRALLEKLRAVVMRAVPDATASIKWGVPVYEKNGKTVCALAAFKEHVGLNLFAPPGVLVDPGKKLEGGGKTSRMLKVRSVGDIDSATILRWLKATAAAKG